MKTAWDKAATAQIIAIWALAIALLIYLFPLKLHFPPSKEDFITAAIPEGLVIEGDFSTSLAYSGQNLTPVAEYEFSGTLSSEKSLYKKVDASEFLQKKFNVDLKSLNILSSLEDARSNKPLNPLDITFVTLSEKAGNQKPFQMKGLAQHDDEWRFDEQEFPFDGLPLSAFEGEVVVIDGTNTSSKVTALLQEWEKYKKAALAHLDQQTGKVKSDIQKIETEISKIRSDAENSEELLLQEKAKILQTATLSIGDNYQEPARIDPGKIEDGQLQLKIVSLKRPGLKRDAILSVEQGNHASISNRKIGKLKNDIRVLEKKQADIEQTFEQLIRLKLVRKQISPQATPKLTKADFPSRKRNAAPITFEKIKTAFSLKLKEVFHRNDNTNLFNESEREIKLTEQGNSLIGASRNLEVALAPKTEANDAAWIQAMQLVKNELVNNSWYRINNGSAFWHIKSVNDQDSLSITSTLEEPGANRSNTFVGNVSAYPEGNAWIPVVYLYASDSDGQQNPDLIKSSSSYLHFKWLNNRWQEMTNADWNIEPYNAMQIALQSTDRIGFYTWNGHEIQNLAETGPPSTKTNVGKAIGNVFGALIGELNENASLTGYKAPFTINRVPQGSQNIYWKGYNIERYDVTRLEWKTVDDEQYLIFDAGNILKTSLNKFLATPEMFEAVIEPQLNNGYYLLRLVSNRNQSYHFILHIE